MVLVAPLIPDPPAILPRRLPDPAAADAAREQYVATLRGCSADIRSGTLRLGGPDPGNCVAYPPTWPAALRDALTAKVIANPLQYETIASFVLGVEEASRLVINPTRAYGDLPLMVLTATVQPPPRPDATAEQLAASAAWEAEWNRAHDELAALSSRGVNVRVPGAHHYIQRIKPQVVIDAVEAVVAEARAGA
jgi:hypothetical protein